MPFVSDKPAPGHSVAGNEHGRQSGVTAIAPDMAWQTEMGRADRLLAPAATAPLLIRYGYPLG